jgi:hypothetical protein
MEVLAAFADCCDEGDAEAASPVAEEVGEREALLFVQA